MIKYRNSANYKNGNDFAETLEKGSKTIPGDSYTIQVLLQKYSQGILPSVKRNVEFIPEENFDLLKPIIAVDRDLTDIDELKQKNAEKQISIKQRQALAKKLKQDKDDKERSEAKDKSVKTNSEGEAEA